MKQKGNFMLRKVMDEYALIPYKETTEEINQVITLSEIAAYIYEHCNAFPQKPDSVINVKVEFGEGEGKGRSDNRYT